MYLFDFGEGWDEYNNFIFLFNRNKNGEKYEVYYFNIYVFFFSFSMFCLLWDDVVFIFGGLRG